MAIPCGRFSVTATGPEGQQVALPLRCRRWDCPNCGPRLKKRLIRRFCNGTPDSLLTLSSNPTRWPSRTAAFKGLSVSLNHLFKRIRRRFPYSEIQYAVVWEVTKDGWPHAHILLRAPFIPQRWLSTAWQDLTGARIVDIRKVTSNREVARYVGKYLTKALNCPPGMKRFRTSRHYSATDSPVKLRDLMELSPFELTPQAIAEIDAAWRSAGLQTSTWLGYILLGYHGPPATPGIDPEHDSMTLPGIADVPTISGTLGLYG